MRASIVSLLLLFAMSLPAAEFRFRETVIDAGFLVEQPVLVADLVGNARCAVLAGRTEDHEQRLAVFSIENPDSPIVLIEVGTNLIAYDVGRIGDAEYLFFVEPGRIVRYDFASDELTKFVDIRSIYGHERTGEIIPIDFIRDVNGDDRDDVVIADSAGYRIRLQRGDGSLGPEFVLQDSSAMSVVNDRVTFRSRQLVSGKMTGDDLPDLAVWRGDELLVYEQLPDLVFTGEPRVFSLGMGLLPETILLSRAEGFGAVNQEGLVEKRIRSMEDLNGDQMPDILTESVLNRGVFDKENSFEIHLARIDGGHIAYEPKEDAVLASSGLQYGLLATDMNGDGRKDLLLRKVQVGFARVIRALLAGNLPLELHFYRMNEDETYATRADFVTRTNVQFSVSSGQVDIPAVLLADLDNDGIRDLLLQTDTNEISVHFGLDSREIFADEAVAREMPLPRNGDLVATEDLDEDGRADLVLRYDESDGTERMGTVRLLITMP